MNILTEIINLLTDNSNQITSSLLKIKVLASRLRNENLLNWIEKELSGYNSKDQLPEYRIYGCILVGSYINGRAKATNHVLSTTGLPDFIKEYLDKFKFYESISVLESYIKEGNSLKAAVPSDVLDVITHNYQESGNPYISVFAAHKQVGVGAVEQAISEIRNKTLDLMLKLEEEFGMEININDLISKKEKVNNIINNTMNQTIINEGDGNVINTGNESTVEVNVKIEKFNFENLAKELIKNNVKDEDINELKEVIKEEPNRGKKLFGSKVNKWIQKMTSKALAGSWDIGVSKAASLLSNLLNQYYGM